MAGTVFARTKIAGRISLKTVFIRTRYCPHSVPVRHRHSHSCPHAHTVPHFNAGTHASTPATAASQTPLARGVRCRSLAHPQPQWHLPPFAMQIGGRRARWWMLGAAARGSASERPQQPATAASFSSAPSKLPSSEAIDPAGRCAGAPATRRSCGRHSGGDGAVVTAERHQTSVSERNCLPRQRMAHSRDGKSA